MKSTNASIWDYEINIILNLYKTTFHLVQEIIETEKVEIRVDTRIQTEIKVKNNNPN
ncbi:hypothetical protein NUSPORA_01058 [Nucleospora cyclopteri]